MKKAKGNGVKEMESGIQSLFEAKQKASQREAFDKFIPFGARSPELRKKLDEMGNSKELPGDERATRSIIELSNVIQPFLYHLSDEQYRELNESFAKTIDNIVRLEKTVVHPPPPPPPPEQPPVQMELEVILSNNDVLRKHIASIESQITFVKDSKKKLVEANKEQMQLLERQNAALRTSLQVAKAEGEQYYQQYLEKESALQHTLLTLTGAQEELKRVKSEFSDKLIARMNNESMESFQRNSKYSAKEFVKLNATIDALRLELSKERLDRSNERQTMRDIIVSNENKLNYSEVIINELRGQLQNIGESAYQSSAEFNRSLNVSATASVGVAGSYKPGNPDIDFLHASSTTAGPVDQLNISQQHETRPHYDHPYTPSVLKGGQSKNLLVQSPIHTLPRGANYKLVEGSPNKSYRYKSPFVVKMLDQGNPAGTPPLYAGQSVQQRSQSAQHQRKVAYGHMTTPTSASRRGGRSVSAGRGGIRSLRGVSAESLRALSGASHTAPSTRHVDTSAYIASRGITEGLDYSASLSNSNDILKHPMFRSLAAKDFNPADHHPAPARDDKHHKETDSVVPGNISRILATTADQHSVAESESVEEVVYVNDDMLVDQMLLPDHGHHPSSDHHHHPHDSQHHHQPHHGEHHPHGDHHRDHHHPHTDRHHHHHHLEEEEDELRHMSASPQRLSQANSFSHGTGSGRSTPLEKRSASLSQMPSAKQLDLSTYRHADQMRVSIPPAPAKHFSDQASSPVHVAPHPHRHHIDQASSPVHHHQLRHHTDQASSPVHHHESHRHHQDQASSPVHLAVPEDGHRSAGTSPMAHDESHAHSKHQHHHHSEELRHMSPSPVPRGLKHAQSFSHQSTSPIPFSHSPLTLDRRSSSLSRVNAQAFDPEQFRSTSTSPLPSRAVQDQASSPVPIVDYSDHLRNMSPTPDRVSRSSSFRDQSPDDRQPLKRSSSMNHKPTTEPLDPALHRKPVQSHHHHHHVEAEAPYEYPEELKNMSPSPGKLVRSISFRDHPDQDTGRPLQRVASASQKNASQVFDPALYRKNLSPVPNEQGSRAEGHHRYSEELRHMSESPGKLVKASSFNHGHSQAATSGPQRAPLTKRSSSLAQLKPGASAPPLTRPESHATFSIQEEEVEEEGHSEGDDDLSTMTPVIVVDEVDQVFSSPAPAPKPPSAAHKDEHSDMLRSLYDQIQQLKLTHLSPAREGRASRLPKASPFHAHGVNEDDREDEFSLASMHADNLAAIQRGHHHHDHHDHHPAGRFEGLVQEYNELLSLYVHEMRKSRSMKMDYKNEIHDSVRSISEFEETFQALNSEKAALNHQLLELKDVLLRKEIQQNQYTTEVEHRVAQLEHEAAAANGKLREAEKDLLQYSRIDARSPSPTKRNPAAAQVESCLVQLKIHSTDREVGKVIELLRKEVTALLDSESRASSPLKSGGSMRHLTSMSPFSPLGAGLKHTSSFRTHKADSVSDVSVGVTVGALKNLLQWIEHTLASNALEINSNVRANNQMREHIDSQEATISRQTALLESKEVLLNECRARVDKLEQQLRSGGPSAAGSQIASLQEQLQATFLELEEAKKRHNGGNLSILNGGGPQRSRSPAATHRSSHADAKQQRDAVFAAHSSRHSPNKIRSSASRPPEPDSIDHHFVSSAEEDAGAHRDTDASRFRDSLMDGSHVRQSHDSVTNASHKSELEKRAIAAEMKCELLANQIKSMPASLSVANAEKRVMECKLNKATLNFEMTIKQMEADSLHKISEFKTFLKLERTEKEALQGKIRDQAATIHQLTHHLKVVHAAKNQTEMSATTASFAYEDGAIKVQVPPAPWQSGPVDSSNNSVSSRQSYQAGLDQSYRSSAGQNISTAQVQQQLRASQLQHESRLRSSFAQDASTFSRRDYSPQRGRRGYQ